MHNLWNRIVAVQHPDEDVQRRSRTLNAVALALMLLALFPLVLFVVVIPSLYGAALAIVVLLLLGSIIALSRRGYFVPAATLLIGITLVLPTAGMVQDRNISTEPVIGLLAPLIATVILTHRQIWFVSLLSIGVLLAGLVSLNVDPLSDTPSAHLVRNAILMVGVTAVIGTISARNTSLAFQAARQASAGLAEAAQRLEQVNLDLERRVAERTASLETALRAVEEREARLVQTLGENEQQRLVIREMSMPIIPISQTTLIMPLVGALDSARLMMLQEQALEAIERNGARTLVIDITGVPVVDTHVARGLIAVVEAARLLGAEVVLVGIRPEVAQAIVGLGLSFTTLPTFSDLQSALRQGRLRGAA
ncbi:MAG TPA: STAS domain-containing protein [Roseiflexaceae bacterium]|nr:STAS domain-containing protein [Roseiflexaceae bacterium]